MKAQSFALINDETHISMWKGQFGERSAMNKWFTTVVVVISLWFSSLLLSHQLPLQCSICCPNCLYNALYVGISS
jgi:hypothetical protein